MTDTAAAQAASTSPFGPASTEAAASTTSAAAGTPAAPADPSMQQLFELIQAQNAQIASLTAIVKAPGPSYAEQALASMSPEEIEAARDALDLPVNTGGDRVALI